MLRLPSICVVCSQYHRQTQIVCAACEDLFSLLGKACRHCAVPLHSTTNFLICGACIKKPPYFDSVLTAYRFEEPLRTLIHLFKYKGALFLRGFLIKLMLDAMPTSGIISTQCLVPIPLHPLKLRTRGFNQAAILARQLAKQLDIPYELNLCCKITHTLPQAHLNQKKRRTNLHTSFLVNPSKYQHITLIDDLMTTGNTANELAKLFKKSGVRQVDVWCCARAVSV